MSCGQWLTFELQIQRFSHTCCFWSLPLLPLGDQPLLKGLGSVSKQHPSKHPWVPTPIHHIIDSSVWYSFRVYWQLHTCIQQG